MNGYGYGDGQDDYDDDLYTGFDDMGGKSGDLQPNPNAGVSDVCVSHIDVFTHIIFIGSALISLLSCFAKSSHTVSLGYNIGWRWHQY